MQKPKLAVLEKLFGGALDIGSDYEEFAPAPMPTLEEAYKIDSRHLLEAYQAATDRLRGDVRALLTARRGG